MARHDVSGVSLKGGGSMRGGLPLSFRGSGEIPREKFGKLWCRRSVFKACFRSKCLVLKLNFESQFDILYAIFCFNFSLYWCCSWHTKKKKGNDQDLTKY